jgi:hypothetical protein
MSPDFDELVGNEVTAAERARLQDAHDLLVAAGPPPELPPELARPVKPPQADIIPFFPKRRYAAAAVAVAAIAAAAFGGGYLAGHPGGGFSAAHRVRMHGTPAAPSALASIQIGKRDGEGNWPMLVRVSYLPKLAEDGYYTLWLTRNGKPVAPCGTFRAHGDKTDVRLTVAYTLKRFDGWVVTRQNPGHHDPGPVVLTT